MRPPKYEYKYCSDDMKTLFHGSNSKTLPIEGNHVIRCNVYNLKYKLL